jgi:hypothetical protein
VARYNSTVQLFAAHLQECFEGIEDPSEIVEGLEDVSDMSEDLSVL